MTTPTQENPTPEQAASNKELNFRALEQRYQRQLEAVNAEKERLQQQLLQSANQKQVQDDDDDDDEPYVVKKKLDKKLAKFGEQTKQQTQSEIQRAVGTALAEERKQNWLKNNPDFYQTLALAEKLYMKDPELADTILEMPDTFERQKLVYKNIKALGLDQPEKKEPSIQDKIDANRRGPYYQPAQIGTAPYAGAQADFSKQGQKDAYTKMQELKSRLRLG